MCGIVRARPLRARRSDVEAEVVRQIRLPHEAGGGAKRIAAELEGHLAKGSPLADTREHGMTHELPIDRLEREKEALRPLAVRPLGVRHGRLRWRVANDAFFDVDTIRYSVPLRLVRSLVECSWAMSTPRSFLARSVYLIRCGPARARCGQGSMAGGRSSPRQFGVQSSPAGMEPAVVQRGPVAGPASKTPRVVTG